MTTQAEYERATEICLHACRQWKAANPDAVPKFRPLPLPPFPGVEGMIAGLDQALSFGVAQNSAARKLLTVMDRATPNGGATVMMAERALETVYGIPHALTVQTGN